MLEEAAKRDHRKIGQDQELFFFHPLSPGSAFFLPHGMIIYQALQSFIREEYWKRGYQEVQSPNMYNSALWKQSGHWQHYHEDMFTFDVEKEQWALKPMNCPGHCLLFGHRERSYRELPLRMAEFGILHRNEASGALTGLTRVRRFVQDDTHIFCTEAQVGAEIAALFDFLQAVYGLFGFTFKMKLSTMPAKHLGDVATWQRAEAQLTAALDEWSARSGTPWLLNAGDGAFYGPKIDVTISDALRRDFQCATIQLDFQLPQQFHLEYRTDEQAPARTETAAASSSDTTKAGPAATSDPTADPSPSSATTAALPHRPRGAVTPGCARPVMIHRAIYGSLERFLAILVEHYSGKWPLWLSPRHMLVVPVTASVHDHARHVHTALRARGLHVDVDLSGATLGKKIRAGQLAGYNFIGVVGVAEKEGGTVNVRARGAEGEGQGAGKVMTVEEVGERMVRMRDERRGHGEL